MFDFSDALRSLKNGKRIARTGWNGKAMWLEIYDPNGDMVFTGNKDYPMAPWIGMKTADEKFVPWLASQTDILALDWVILEN